MDEPFVRYLQAARGYGRSPRMLARQAPLGDSVDAGESILTEEQRLGDIQQNGIIHCPANKP
jgi:hypothetical protein